MLPITLPSIQSFLKKRTAESHKGTYGHALLIAGSEGRMGAAVIASKACLKSGWIVNCCNSFYGTFYCTDNTSRSNANR